MKLALFAFCILSVFFVRESRAQVDCTGNQIFTERKCAGDDVSKLEQELFRIVNEYRAQNNLPPVPLSPALSVVANRHLLDLEKNLNQTTHSWSNCAYEIKDRNTWDCVFGAPQRLGTGYPGKGYENLYRNIGAPATPPLALESWKKSPLHNGLILNLNFFKDDVYDACGVAVRGSYIALWFGSSKGAQNNAFQTKKETKLNLTFEQVTNGLDEILNIKKTSTTFESNKWVGTSADKSTVLEIYGRRESIFEATLNFRVRLVKNKLTEKDKSVMLLFLKNVMPDWAEREKWFADALDKLYKNPKLPQNYTEDKRKVSLDIDRKNIMSLTVEPDSKNKK